MHATKQTEAEGSIIYGGNKHLRDFALVLIDKRKRL